MKQLLATLIAATVAISASAEDQRAAYAYGLNATLIDGGCTFRFDITSPTCTAAKLIFKDEADHSFEREVTVADPTQTVVYDFTDFASVAKANGLAGNIEWSVEISSTVPGTEPVVVLREAGYKRATNARCYGGIAIITDPQYPTFGMAMAYTETRNGVTPGIDLIDQKLNVTTKFRDSSDAGFTKIGSQCIPFERMGRFIISSWSDGGSGLYMYDPATPDVLPVQMFQGTRNAAGLFTYGSASIGGSVPAACVSLDGKSIYTFDEELEHPTLTGYDHVFARYDIGDEWTIATAPDWFSNTILSYTESSGKLSSSRPANNSANNFAVTPWGIMISQVRWVNSDEHPSYIFWDPENDKILKEYGPSACADFVSSGGGMAINRDYTLMARAGYFSSTADITVHEIEWEDVEGGKAPVIGTKKWTCAANSLANVLRFDYAGNLYLYDKYQNTTNNYAYTIYAFPGDYNVTTPCLASNKLFVDSSSITDLNADCDTDATYFDMSGRAVKADNLSAGVYVKFVGGKATKVVIR